MLNFGFAKEVITPDRGESLAGYFNPRPNRGAYDDLFVKALVMSSGKTFSGIVLHDLCFLNHSLIETIKKALVKSGIKFADKIIFASTHTHSGPNTQRFFGADANAEYLKSLVEKTVIAVQRAFRNLAPGEVLTAKAECTYLAFNRRYWMKDGTVLTNPGRLNPNVVKSEGPVDYDIPLIAFRQDGEIRLLIANIVNHTDTIGNDMVSADWPGRMERELQNYFGYDLPVMTLIGCSGNINHFNIKTDADQTNYKETNRVGKCYASAIIAGLNLLRPIKDDSLKVDSTVINVPFYTISEEEFKRAKEILKKTKNCKTDENMTSEGIAKGEGPVARFFAEQLIAFKESCSGKKRDFIMMSIKIGKDIGVVSIPGEPFTEIGLAIKEKSKFPLTMVATLAMGELGYIPMPECYNRGGYEILPIEGGTPAKDTAPRLIETGIKLLK